MSEKVDKIILQMLIKAGVDGKATVFLFSDNQIKEESFVEDINMILNTGDVPNIFPADEKADVIEKMQTVARVEVREEITPVCLIDQLRFLDLHVVENSIPKLAHKDAKFFMLTTVKESVGMLRNVWGKPWFVEKSGRLIFRLPQGFVVEVQIHIPENIS